MASPEEIEVLRRLVNEPTDDNYSDEYLSAVIDATDTMYEAAAVIWREKAAKFSTMVNVSESGSSRSMQNLYDNAIRMVNYYDGRVDSSAEPGTELGAPFTIGSERL